MPVLVTMPAKPAKPSLKGKEIVDPQMAVFVKLEDLQRVVKKELVAQRDVLVQFLNTQLIIEQHLKAIKDKQTARQDEGDYYYEEETATTTDHTLDLNAMWGYPVKGYILKNDSRTVDIFAAHVSRRDMSLDFAEERFFRVRPREEFVTPNNIKVVWKLIIKTEVDTADYRLWLLW